MQFALFGLASFALVAAGPLAVNYSNVTSSTHSTGSASSSSAATWVTSQMAASPFASVKPQSRSSTTLGQASLKTVSHKATSATNTARYVHANATTTLPVILPPAHVTNTVYLAEVVVTVINKVTIIATVYNVPVTTTVGAITQTFQPKPQVTSTKTVGTQTIVVIQPTGTAPIPTLTSTITLGDVVSTVLVVPAAGPTSTKGAPAPSQPAAPTYMYTATNNVCACPLPTTVTQYVTIHTTPTSASTVFATTSSPVAPANCAAPATAAYPTLFPGLIIPVQASHPAVSYGTQYVANITSQQEAVFQFNVKNSGKCSLDLALPPIKSLTTSSWAITGDGLFSFAKLSSSVAPSLSYAQLPGSLTFKDFAVVQGGTAVLGRFDCVAGTTATFVLKSKNGATAQFFEDYNCPYVGLSLIQA